jgi:hypothetical protein
MVGGLLGLGPLVAIAAAVLTDPPEIGRAFAAVPILMAAAYLVPVWASVAARDLRQPILRGSVVASLVVAFAGSWLFGFATLLALMPATALLWLASGGLKWRR